MTVSLKINEMGSRRAHELHGHVPFDQLMIAYESNIFIGQFDGWVEVDRDGTITQLWVDGFNQADIAAVELQFTFPRHEGDWLACRIRDAVEKEFGKQIREAITDRNPRRSIPDYGPAQEQRL